MGCGANRARRANGRWRGTLAAVLGLLAIVVATAPPARAEIGDYRCADPGRVYHGNPRLIRRPAVVAADRVYARIPEYQQVLREGLTDKDVRYHFLMKQASRKFVRAVKDMAHALEHDFVAERGAIVVVRDRAPEPPDRTDEVIGRLE